MTVLNWIRTFGKSVKTYVQAELPDDIRDVDIIEMDEMWHFTKKKTEALDLDRNREMRSRSPWVFNGQSW